MLAWRPTRSGAVRIVCLSLALGSTTWAQPSPLKASDADIQRWRDMKFGLFVHWGPVSLKGTEIGWSRGAQVPVDEYDQL